MIIKFRTTYFEPTIKRKRKMEITLKVKGIYGYDLIFEAENVKISEDVEDRIYSKTEDGKIDFKTPPKRDFKTETLVQFSSLLEDMIHYREAEFDSRNLIERLFEKLPQEIADNLLTELKRMYED